MVPGVEARTPATTYDRQRTPFLMKKPPDRSVRCSSFEAYRNVLPENEIWNQRRRHVCCWRCRRCAAVSDLMPERPIGHHRRRWITPGVDVHQRHSRHLRIVRFYTIFFHLQLPALYNYIRVNGYLIRSRGIRWCRYSVHDWWRLYRRLTRRVVRGHRGYRGYTGHRGYRGDRGDRWNHVNRLLIRVFAWCRRYSR